MENNLKRQKIHTIIKDLPTQPEKYLLQVEYTWIQDAFYTNITLFITSEGFIEKIFKSDENPELNQLKTQYPIHVLKDRALIPGMINVHSHAFQRNLRGKGEIYPLNQGINSFWTWREEMYSLVKSMTSSQFLKLTKQTFQEMKACGITTTAEFHYLHHDKSSDFAYDELILKAAFECNIRIVLLNAYYQYGGFGQKPLSESQKRFETNNLDEYWNHMDILATKLRNPIQSLGVVAHSLRAVDIKDFISLYEESQRRKMLFHLHIEEQPQEVKDCQEILGGRPMEMVLKSIQVNDRVTAVHCTYTDSSDLTQYIQAGGHVCICPLTEGNLGDGIPDLKACQGRISLGSDCNARIDMLEEIRWLEYIHRLNQNRRGICSSIMQEEDLPKELFSYATKNGAKALHLPVGEIKEGNFADFALIDLNSTVLNGWEPKTLMASIIFGCSGQEIVIGTAVSGCWDVKCVETHVESIPQKRNSMQTDKSKSIERTFQEEEASKLADPKSSEVIPLALALINTQSLSGEETPMANILKPWLESRGWKVQLQQVPPQKGHPCCKPRYNVLATRGNYSNPKILLNSHIDTVPPYFPARMDKTSIYGRGACDTKSLLASQMIAAQKLVEEDHIEDIGILYVVSEETDHSGMIKANELKLTPEAMIVAEPTGMKLMRRQKGIVKFRLISKGVACHSGYPELGTSAIEPLIDVLSDLKNENWPSDPKLGTTTLNIGIIEGGQAANALPDHASALCMFRIITPPNVICDRVRELVQDRVEIDFLTMNPPVELGILSSYETDIACFNTDIPYFKNPNVNGQAYLFGPGNIMDAHCSREYILQDELKQSVDVYRNMVKLLLNK